MAVPLAMPLRSYLMHDHPRDACGVVGMFGVNGDAAPLIMLGLHALQHRGQESAGIVSVNEGKLYTYKGMGLVANVFSDSANIHLPGSSAIGHVRYSTAGASTFANAQPLFARYMGNEVALAHNGNLANGNNLEQQLVNKGALFQTTTDSELMLHMLAQEKACTDQEIADVLGKIGPAFAVVMLFNDRLIAARDAYGYRPLVLGRLGSAYVVASETCALDQQGATFVREVEPGEMLVIDNTGMRSLRFGEKAPCVSQCLLELIYFARPDSFVFGETPHLMREVSGEALAKEHPADVDIVVAIPDSGMSAAMGFASALGIPLERGLIRNHYVGRSFIAPGQAARIAAVRMKHNIVKDVVRGKRVALVDDSLIRGTTTASLGKALREAGATEVHLRIACPPTRHACVYGVDFPKPQELLAHNHSLEEIQSILGMDSLGYLSLERLTEIFKERANTFCTACWSGVYTHGNISKKSK